MLRTESPKKNEYITGKALLCSLNAIVVGLLLILPSFAADKQKDEETLRRANIVLQDMLNSKEISPEALSKADCVLILPNVKKFGLGVGGMGGRGPLLCRSGARAGRCSRICSHLGLSVQDLIHDLLIHEQ